MEEFHLKSIYEAYADEWKPIIEKSEYEFIQLYGKLNSLDIASMQRAVLYGTQYYKLQEKQHESDNAFTVVIDGCLHDKYQKDGMITVKSRDGF